MNKTHYPFLPTTSRRLRKRWLLVALWPVVAIALCLAGSWWLERDEARSRTAVDALAKKETRSLASAYALQLSQTVDQLDRNLLNLKYFREVAPQSFNLPDFAKRGMYSPQENVHAMIFDGDGKLVDSTLAISKTVNIANDPVFGLLAKNATAGLAITKHEFTEGVTGATVWFSRRLEKSGGEFAGIVSIVVEPRFLGTYYDQTALGRGDFITVRSTTGKILSTRMGERIQSYTGIFAKPPTFRQPRGVELYGATYFRDAEPRLYAWHTLEKYPLISTVGLLQSDIYAELEKNLRSQRQAALIIAAIICLVAIVGMLLTFTSLRRSHLAQVGRDRYLAAIESGDEGFFSLYPVVDKAGTSIDFVIAECNGRGAALLGFQKAEMTGNLISRFCSPEKFPALLTKFLTAMGQGSYEDEFVQRTPDGANRVLYRHLIRSTHGIALTLRDVSQTKQHEAALHEMANHDALTDAYNRHWFMSNLPAAMARASSQQKPLALLFIDLDNFKEINNTFGHSAGDTLLVLTCRRFREVIRPQDHIVRLGGDEFTIILEKAGRSEIVDIADRIIDVMLRPFDIDGVAVDMVRASIGISIFPDDGMTVDALVHHADKAMYAAKRAGKANYRFYQAEQSGEGDAGDAARTCSTRPDNSAAL